MISHGPFSVSQRQEGLLMPSVDHPTPFPGHPLQIPEQRQLAACHRSAQPCCPLSPTS